MRVSLAAERGGQRDLCVWNSGQRRVLARTRRRARNCSPIRTRCSVSVTTVAGPTRGDAARRSLSSRCPTSRAG